MIAKSRKKPGADDIVIVAVGHVNERGAFSRGQRVRAGTPGLDLSLAVPDGTPQSGWPTSWDEDPPPVELGTQVRIPPSIPPHRQVEAQVDVWFDGGFAPGSPGAKGGRPSGFGTAIRRGRIYDALTPVVRQHPDWFCWVRREVQSADLERLERLEAEGEHAV